MNARSVSRELFPSFPELPLADPTPDVGAPLPNQASNSLIEALQGNILKGFGREHARLVFFRFGASADRNQEMLVAAVDDGWVTTAAGQLSKIDLYKHELKLLKAAPKTRSTKLPASFSSATEMVGSLMLTGAGLKKIDGSAVGGVFDRLHQGMKGSIGSTLTKNWSAPYTEGFDGMFLLACDCAMTLGDATTGKVADLIAWCETHGATVLSQFIENGSTWRFPGPDLKHPEIKGNTREPFGFSDGISMPMFFQEERRDCPAKPGLPDAWEWIDLRLDNILIDFQSDPDSARKRHVGGSFFVLLKMEQDVGAFHTYEQTMIDCLVKTGVVRADAEMIAPVLLTGRDRQGEPLPMVVKKLQAPALFIESLFPARATATAAGGFSPALNQFDFMDPKTNGRCPFHAHIRKMNPRDTRVMGSREGICRAQLARRGIVFDPTGWLDAAEAGKKSWPGRGDGVGLLFMAYMADIDGQFLKLHSDWATDTKFPPGADGQTDPFLFGQSGEWNFGKATFPEIPALVTRLGGEYFFVPTIQWLENGGQ